MALNFPTNPYVGQQYDAPNGVIYAWDGMIWAILPVSITGNIIFSNNTVTTNNAGNIYIATTSNLWEFSTSGTLIFPDNTQQVTAYTGSSGGCATWASLGNKTNACGPYNIALGKNAGSNNCCGAIAIGPNAGNVGQMCGAIAVGFNTGYSDQGYNAVAIGSYAGAATQRCATVAVGTYAGHTCQSPIAVAIGPAAGETGQGTASIAIGIEAAACNQGYCAIAIGPAAAACHQQPNAIAIGRVSGLYNQHDSAIAIGCAAGKQTQSKCAITIGTCSGSCYQGNAAIAVGAFAGKTNQSSCAVAIGINAGNVNQGNSSVAIGPYAAQGISIARTLVDYCGISLCVGSTTDIITGLYVTGPGFTGGQTVVSISSCSALLISNLPCAPLTGGETITFVGHQASCAVAIGSGAGYIKQCYGGIAIGTYSGALNQGTGAVAIGSYAGIAYQSDNTVAIGNAAGACQQHARAVAIGSGAGSTNQGCFSVAIGSGGCSVSGPGYHNQGQSAVAIGINAGKCNQGVYAVSIGPYSGVINQSPISIAIGASAGYDCQGSGAIAIGVCSAAVNQGYCSVAIGTCAAVSYQGIRSIAVGTYAAGNHQGDSSVAIGYRTASNTQGICAVAIGICAANNNQGNAAIAIGSNAGINNQGMCAVAIGPGAARNQQAIGAVGIGGGAGYCSQQNYAVAVGIGAGYTNQGACSIAIGRNAGDLNQPINSIIINAAGTNLNGMNSGLYIAPVRNDTGNVANAVYYNTITNEITYSAPSIISELVNGSYTLSLDNNGILNLSTSRYGTSQIISFANEALIIGIGGQSDIWQFNTDGRFILPGTNGIIQFSDNSQQSTAWLGSTSTLVNGNATVTLTNTGQLILPSTNQITASSPQLGNIVTNIESYNASGAPYYYGWFDSQPNWTVWYNTYGANLVGWTIYPIGDINAAVVITSYNPIGDNTLGFSAPLGSGPYTAYSPGYVPASSSPVIIAPNSNVWTFGTNGDLEFPDTSIQSTAWLGSLPTLSNHGANLTITQTPTHSIGQSGDIQGMVAFDSGYIYYCKENYTATIYNYPSYTGEDTSAVGSKLKVDTGGTTPDLTGYIITGSGITGNVTVTGPSVPADSGETYFPVSSDFYQSPGIYTFTPDTNIWVRLAWSADVW